MGTYTRFIDTERKGKIMNTRPWHGTCNALIPKTTKFCQGVEFDDPADMVKHLREVHNRKPSTWRPEPTKLRLQTGPTKGGMEKVLAKYAGDVEYVWYEEEQ